MFRNLGGENFSKLTFLRLLLIIINDNNNKKKIIIIKIIIRIMIIKIIITFRKPEFVSWKEDRKRFV